MALHSKAEAHALIERMSEKDFQDGVVVDVPKKRRRAQAMGLKQIRINVPKDLQKRFATQVNRYVELLGKDLGWDLICSLLEHPVDKRLRVLAEEEGRES